MQWPTDPFDLFLSLCAKPGMYVCCSRFEGVWSFIDGYDVATDGKTLRGFAQWLCVRRGEFRNSTWYQQVMEDVDHNLIRVGAGIPDNLHDTHDADSRHRADRKRSGRALSGEREQG